MAAGETATLLTGSVEWEVQFQPAQFEEFARPGYFESLAFRALSPFGLRVADLNRQGDARSWADSRLTAQLWDGRLSARLSVSSLSLLVSDLRREDAASAPAVASSVLEAFREATGIVVASQSAQAAFHVRPAVRTPSEVTKDLVRPPATIAGRATGFGFSAYEEGRYLIVDMSALDPDALFVKVWLRISPEAAPEVAAKELESRMAMVLEALGIRTPLLMAI